MVEERELARFAPQHGWAVAAALAYALVLVAIYGARMGAWLALRVYGGALLLGLLVAWALAWPRRVLTTRRLVVTRGRRREAILLRDVAEVRVVPLAGWVVVRPRHGKAVVLRGVRRPREAARRIRLVVEDSCEGAGHRLSNRDGFHGD